jgi:uncharacterized protein YceH (UPF0502 family)
VIHERSTATPAQRVDPALASDAGRPTAHDESAAFEAVQRRGIARRGVKRSYARDVDADPVQLRVLGSLIEKQRTTPDVYPLSLNALRLACNQATNRDPVVDYDEPTIRTALERLSDRQWVRLASGPGSRAVKYRHLFDEALDLSGGELSLLAVLMLRGPQTIGELKGRTERLHRFESLPKVEETLNGLAARELVARLGRRPGQKEERWSHLLGGEQEPAAEAPARTSSDLEERVEQLEAEVAELRRLLESAG